MTTKHLAADTPQRSAAHANRARSVSRRAVLATAGGLGIAAVAGLRLSQALPASAASTDTTTGTLTIPPLLTATDDNGTSVYTLSMQTGSSALLTGLSSSTMGFNGSYLGPTIKVSNGDQVRMEVTNSLGEDTTVHWHGAHVPASVDGGPQNVFSSGTTYQASFTVNQGGACTLWYHPHALGSTARQVSHGLAGMLIVEDSSAASSALPNTYGVDDIPLIVQSVPITTSTGVIQYTLAGITASTTSFPLIVNGANASVSTPTLTTTANRLRFRLLNGSISDVLTFSMTDGSSFSIVASDAGYLTAPLAVTTLRLVPGERAEIILDVTSTSTRTLQALQTAGEPKGGSATTPVVTITSTATSTAGALPTSLATISAIDTSSATARTITYGGGGGAFTINGVAGTTMAAMEGA